MRALQGAGALIAAGIAAGALYLAPNAYAASIITIPGTDLNVCTVQADTVSGLVAELKLGTALEAVVRLALPSDADLVKLKGQCVSVSVPPSASEEPSASETPSTSASPTPDSHFHKRHPKPYKCSKYYSACPKDEAPDTGPHDDLDHPAVNLVP
jgi:hypothetical protein